MADMDKNPAPGRAPVGVGGIIGVGLYVVLLTVLALYVLLKVWPYPTPSMEAPAAAVAAADSVATDSAMPPDSNLAAVPATAAASPLAADSSAGGPLWLECRPDLQRTFRQMPERDRNSIPKCVNLFGKKLAIWDEQRLLLIVMAAGALGGLVHGIRSLAIYIGNRQLRWSWMGYYLLLPFSGASVAVVFYLVIRGGFFSPSSDFSETSPYGFAALSAIVGLFSQHALLKLQKLAETMFERPPREKDALAEETDAAKVAATASPVITDLKVAALVAGGREDVVEITGTNFTEQSQLDVNGKARSPEYVTATQLRLQLEPAELAILENGGALRLAVVNPGDARSNVKELSE